MSEPFNIGPNTLENDDVEVTTNASGELVIRDRNSGEPITIGPDGLETTGLSVAGTNFSAKADRQGGTLGDVTPLEAVHTDESRTTSREITINVPSDFNTVAEAFDEIDEIRRSPGLYYIINIETGHDLQTYVSRNGADYRDVTVTSEDAEVGLADDFGTRNVFQFSNYSVSPKFDILVNGEDSTGTDHEARAYQIQNGSTVFFTEGSGAKHCDAGVFCLMGGRGYGFNTVFTDHTRRGVNVTNGSIGYFEQADVSRCGDYGVRVGSSYCDIGFVTAHDCGSNGIRANGSAYVSAQGADVSGSSTGYLVNNGSRVLANNATITNTNRGVISTMGSNVCIDGASISNIAGMALECGDSSKINASNITIDTTRGIHAYDRSTINVTGSITNSDWDGVLADGSTINVGASVTGSNQSDLAIANGGILSANGQTTSSTGDEPHSSDASHAFNTINGAGIIFADGFESA